MKSLEPNLKLVTSAICVLPGKMAAIYSTMFQLYVCALSTSVCPTEGMHSIFKLIINTQRFIFHNYQEET